MVIVIASAVYDAHPPYIDHIHQYKSYVIPTWCTYDPQHKVVQGQSHMTFCPVFLNLHKRILGRIIK